MFVESNGRDEIFSVQVIEMFLSISSFTERNRPFFHGTAKVVVPFVGTEDQGVVG